MFNQPFSITTNNYTTEKTANSQPTNLLGQNVILSQEQQRNIHDRTTTTITGLPQFYPNYPNNGVVFTFNSNQPIAAVQQNMWPNQFEQLLNTQSNNIMQLQQFMRNEPYMLRFHTDHQTSTTDLAAQRSRATDLKNLAGLFERLPDWVRFSPTDHNYRKLILKNPKIEKVATTIVEDLHEEQKTKTENVPKDAEVQTNLCQCDDNGDDVKVDKQTETDNVSNDVQIQTNLCHCDNTGGHCNADDRDKEKANEETKTEKVSKDVELQTDIVNKKVSKDVEIQTVIVNEKVSKDVEIQTEIVNEAETSKVNKKPEPKTKKAPKRSTWVSWWDSDENFIDLWYTDLENYQNYFQNQVLGLAQFLPNILNAKEKIKNLENRLILLHNHQRCIEYDLTFTENSLKQAEVLLAKLEMSCNSLFHPNQPILDRTRTELYKKCEDIFTLLANYKTVMDRIDLKVYKSDAHKNPIYYLCAVVDNNLKIMEVLYQKMELMQKYLNEIQSKI